ncbi:MAG: PAS domain S-box protein, partial [Rhodocyclaceae bacterium]
IVWVLDRGDVVERDVQGAPLRMVGSLADISEHKETELALADEIAKRQTLFEHSRDGIVVLDETGKVCDVNHRFADMLGYTLDEAHELHVWDWDAKWDRGALQEAIRCIDEAGDHFETRHRRKDGSLYDAEISSNGTVWSGRKLVFCVCRDVTQRNSSAAALRAREQEISAVLRAAPVGIGVTVDRIVVEANAYLGQLLGYPAEELRGMPARTFYESDAEYERVGREKYAQIAATGTGTVETRWRRRDGELVDILLSSSNVDPGLPERGTVFTVLDISSSKRAQAQLRKGEAHLRTLVETIPDLVWLKDLQGVYLACNPMFERLYGAEQAQIVGKTDYDFTTKEVADAFRRHDLEAIEAGRPTVNEEWLTYADDGHRALVETIKTPMRDAQGGVIGVLGIAREITASRQAEDMLRQRERYQRALIDNFPFAVWLKDTQSRFLAVNETLASMFGASGPDALVGKTDFDLSPPKMAEGYHADDLRVLASRTSRMVEEEILDQGVRKWFETYKAPVVDASGELLGTVGFARDITDQREAAAALAESEARFRRLFEDMAEAALLIEDGRFVDANRAALQMLRVADRHGVVGKSPGDFSPPSQPDGRPSAPAVLAAMQRAFDHGAYRFEWACLRADGDPFFAEVLLTPILHRTKRLLHVVWRDISERKRMEVALRESEFFLKESQKIGLMGGWRADPRSNTLMWTEGVYALLEMPLEYKPDLETGLDFYPPSSRERVLENLTRILETGESFAIETELCSRTGKDLWVELRGFAHREGERVAYLVGTIQDITARRLLDAALRESEARSKLILDTAPEAMLVVDAEGRVIVANARADRVFGYASGSMLGLAVESLIPERFRHTHEGYRAAFAKHPQSRPMDRGLNLFGRRCDGSEFPVEVGLGPLHLGDQAMIIVSVLDISARKQAEADLRESQRILHQAQAIARVGSWSADLAARTFTASEEGARLVGWTPGARQLEEFLQVVYPDDRTRMQAAWHQALETGHYEIEHRVSVKGTVRWIFVKGEIAFDYKGRPISAVGVTKDTTEVREAQIALQAHKEHLEELVVQRTAELDQQARYLRALIDNVPHPVWLKDTAGRYLVSNRTNALGCGVPLDAMIGATDFEIWPRELAQRYRADDLEVIRSGRQKVVEEPYADVTKGEIWIETCKTPVLADHGEVIATAGFARDISAHKVTEAAREAALREARRLAQVRSDFLANMSHEIRTPLNAVLGLAQVGARESVGRKSGQTFQRIRDSGQLLLGIINDILDFSKIEAGKLNLDRAPFSLGEAIDRAVDVTAEKAYAKGIEMAVHEAADLPATCIGDPLRLSQILVNLLSNAIKFTDRGGVTLVVSRTGQILSLRVEDTGIGMTPEQLGRLFQPFEQADGSTT